MLTRSNDLGGSNNIYLNGGRLRSSDEKSPHLNTLQQQNLGLIVQQQQQQYSHEAIQFQIRSDYDYNKSTSENYSVEGKDVPFVGKYSGIRSRLDYSYHNHYCPERQYLHDKLIDRSFGSIFANSNLICEKMENQWLLFTAGTMGVGKGYVLKWLSRQGLFPLESFVPVDPDRLREELPESQQYFVRDAATAGKFTQREVGYMSEVLTLFGLQSGKNVLMDGSLRDANWYGQYIQRLKAEFPSLKIGIFYVTARLKTILSRAKQREVVTRRHVPEETIVDAYYQVPASVEQLSLFADVVVTFDNDSQVSEPTLLQLRYPKTEINNNNNSNGRNNNNSNNNNGSYSARGIPIPISPLRSNSNRSFHSDVTAADALSVSSVSGKSVDTTTTTATAAAMMMARGMSIADIDNYQSVFSNNNNNSNGNSLNPRNSRSSKNSFDDNNSNQGDDSVLRALSSDHYFRQQQQQQQQTMEEEDMYCYEFIEDNSNNSNLACSPLPLSSLQSLQISHNNNNNNNNNGGQNGGLSVPVLSSSSRGSHFLNNYTANAINNNSNNGSNSSSSSGKRPDSLKLARSLDESRLLFPPRSDTERSNNNNNNNNTVNSNSGVGGLLRFRSISNDIVESNALRSNNNNNNNNNLVNNNLVNSNNNNKSSSNDDDGGGVVGGVVVGSKNNEWWRREFQLLWQINCLVPDFEVRKIVREHSL